MCNVGISIFFSIIPISADPALRVERRGSPLFHFLGLLGSLGSCCARNGFGVATTFVQS